MSASRVDLGHITLSVADEGPRDGPLLVLVHGFPELAYSWRHQIGPLVDAGYRVLAHDLRGTGGSDAPADISAYAVAEQARDVLALIDHAGAETAILIGHDWGADVVWKTAWMHPDRVSAVAGLSVPFIPRAPAPPIEIMRRHLGEGFYIVWFQEPGVAEAELERDVRRTIATTKVWNPEWAATEEDPPTPAHMTDEDVAVYVAAYERTGFAGALNMYRNLDRNWEQTAPFEDRRIDQPALFLTGERDPVRTFMPVEAMTGWVTDLRASVVIPGAGHWVNQEEPEQVNAALLDWLRALP